MKKILPFALAGFAFVVFFLLPRPALAFKNSIPVCDGTKVNLNNPDGTTNNFPPYPKCLMAQDRDSPNDFRECGANEKPCDNDKTLCRGANGNSGPRCLPNGQTTKYPTCPPGPEAMEVRVLNALPPECWKHDDGTNNFMQFASQCCRGAKDATGIAYYCENKYKPGITINFCSEIKDNATLSDKTYCGDGIFEYDPGTKLCFQKSESVWKLNFSPCTGGEGISTAIGCIPTNGPDGLKGFLEFVLKWAFFASGGIIVLMVIATGYTLLTSQGNPEKLQAAKENLVALFSGLILIAFSLVLLQTIGADILKLPTF